MFTQNKSVTLWFVCLEFTWRKTATGPPSGLTKGQSVKKVTLPWFSARQLSKWKNYISHFTIVPLSGWQGFCGSCAISIQRDRWRLLGSAASGRAKRSLFCLWLVPLLDLAMCGDFHIFATRMAEVSSVLSVFIVCYSKSGTSLLIEGHEISSWLCLTRKSNLIEILTFTIYNIA